MVHLQFPKIRPSIKSYTDKRLQHTSVINLISTDNGMVAVEFLGAGGPQEDLWWCIRIAITDESSKML